MGAENVEANAWIFARNLPGAVLGGLKSTALMALVLYLVAFLLVRRRATAA